MRPNLEQERRWDRFFITVWLFFCVIYYLPGIILGGLSPTSPVWYFERQLQWLPFANYARFLFTKGIFPAWCPHFYGGFPLLAYPPNLWYFPPNFVLQYLSNYEGSFVVHLLGSLVAGPFFYWTLRKLSLSPVASCFGLLAFLGGMYYNIQAAYGPYPMFIYPVLLWAVAGLLRDQLRIKYLVTLLISSGLAFGFDLEQDFYLLGTILIFAPFLAKPPKVKRILVVGTGLGFALLIMLSPVINLAGYTPHTVRGEGISFRNYIGSSQFPDLFMFLGLLLFPDPGKFPVHFQALYPGWICLLMLGLGVKRLGVKGLTSLFFLILTWLYVLSWPPLCRILFQIPVLNKLALHYSAMIVPYLGLSILASIGAEEFLEKRSRISLFLLVVLIVVLIFVLFFSHLDWIRLSGLLICLGLGLVLIFRPRFHPQWLWPVLLILGVIFDLSYLAFKLQPRARAKELEPSPAVLDFLSREKQMVRFWPLSKYLYEDTLVHPLVGMNLPIELPGTHSPLGYWRMPTMRMAKLINLITPGYLQLDSEGKLDFLDPSKARDPKLIDERDLFYLRLLNVGNLISRGVRLETSGIELLGSSGDIHFYRLPETLPRYFLVSEIKEVSAPEEGLELIARKEFDPRKTALVEGRLKFFSSEYNPGRVFLRRFLPGKWELEVDLPELYPGRNGIAEYFLVIGESYLPGWRAYAKEKELRVYRANYTFFGVALLPGHYRVEIIYRPFQTRIGLWCGVGSFLFWVILGMVILKFGRQKERRA